MASVVLFSGSMNGMKIEIGKRRGFGRLTLGIFSLTSLTGMLLLPVEAKAGPGVCLQMTNCIPLITCTGTPYETYRIETTTCLTAPVSWVPLCTYTVDATGCFQMLDIGASNCPARFYRAVQVATRRPGQYSYGVLAKGPITISGGSTLDSFNSTDPNYSTNGMYTASKREANMKLATDSGAVNAVSVGNAVIYGSVDTGPGTNTVTVGSIGSVGDLSWVTNALDQGKIEPGHANDDMNVSIPDIQPPYNSLALPSLPATVTNKVNGTNYTYILGNTNYYYPFALSISGGQSMVVTGAATLYVTGNFAIGGNSFIYIAPGGSLQLYVGTTNAGGKDSITISGGGIANGTGSATNLAIYGLPSVSTATYAGSARFIGVFNSPEAAVTMSGGSDGIGALVGNTITMGGGMSFHYDEALGAE
jgi:hypothetical protein